MAALRSTQTYTLVLTLSRTFVGDLDALQLDEGLIGTEFIQDSS